jgi:hypothetical protein
MHHQSQEERTNGSRLNHIADRKSLYRLIFGCTPGTVGASNRFDMATTLLVAPTMGNFVSFCFDFSKSFALLGRSLPADN